MDGEMISIMISQFILFMRSFYGSFLPVCLGLALIETALVTVVHAMLGHGLKLTWLYGAKPTILTNKEDAERERIGRHINNKVGNFNE